MDKNKKVIAKKLDHSNFIGKFSRLIFECKACEKIYNRPGICDICKVVLKLKGG